MICERQIISWLAGSALSIGPRGLVADVGWISRKSGCTEKIDERFVSVFVVEVLNRRSLRDLRRFGSEN